MALQTEQLYQTLGNLKKARLLFSHTLDLPPGEYFVLSRVGKLSGACPRREACEGGAPRTDVFVSDLRDHSHITLSAVSQLLSALERKGLIVRTMSTVDRRRISVSITPEGESLLGRVQRQTDQTLRELVRRFGEEDTRALMALLDKLGGVIEQMQQQTSGEEGRH